MSKQKQTFIDRYRMYPWYLNLAIILFYLFWSLSSPLYTSVLQYKNIISDPFDGTVTPIEYVPEYLAMKESALDKNYLDLPSSVFVKTPKYDTKVLTRNIENLKPWDDEYEETLATRVIYSTVYMWNYNYDYKEYAWSHPAVDIKSPVWAPVRNIANWVVVQVWNQPSWFGNFVVIKHNNVPLPNWEYWTIYSNYCHMNEVYVKEWRKIKKWSVIWTVWNTGMSFGSHLHFQIDTDTAPFHPYRPFTWKEARDAKVNFFDAINIWLWKENAIKYTINPAEFVYKNINNILVKKEDDKDIVVLSSNKVVNINENKDEKINIITEDNKEDRNEEKVNTKTSNKEKISKKENNDKTQKEVIVDTKIEEKNKEEEIKEVLKEEVKIEKLALLDDDLELSTNDIVVSDNLDVALSSTQDLLSDISSMNSNIIENNDNIVLESAWEEPKNIIEQNYNEQELNSENKKQEENISVNLEENEDNTSKEVKKEIEEEITADSIFSELEKINLDNENILVEEWKISFSDLNPDTKYYDAIKFLANKWVINGFSDWTFRINNNITRAESLKVILLSFNKGKNEETSKIFDDVIVKSWENWYISKWIELWLISSKNKNFYPNRTVNRVEWLKMLLKIANVDVDKYIDKDISLDDVNKNDWYYKYIVYAVENNLLEFNNKFLPEQPLTRWELANMIYLMLEH